MALLPPTSGGGVGTTVHNDLTGRSAPDAHPISAITGLADWLAQHDAALEAAEALRYIFMFSNTSAQDIFLPQPLNSMSVAVVTVRTADGAMIEPEVRYMYGPDPERFIERIRLTFTPVVSGEHIVHIIR